MASKHLDEKKILVVDDEEDIRWIIRAILERSNMHVIEAGNGQKALELIEKDAGNEISCVITDYLMPQMNGIQLCHLLREKYGNRIGIFLITAYLDKERFENTKCFDGKFMKPLDFDSFVRSVKTKMLAYMMA